jgi:hypothetical protein
MAGAIDGVHGLRLELMLSGYDFGIVPFDHFVTPAFERRGFQVLNFEQWTKEQWKDYINEHQLWGANTLTVNPPAVYFDPTEDPDSIETARLQAEFDVLVDVMEHCQKIGVKFQVNTGANLIDPSFHWQSLQLEQCHFETTLSGLPPTNCGMNATTFVAEDNDGVEFHRLPEPLNGASLSKVGAGPHLTLLNDGQRELYKRFSDVDAFVVGTNEGASDFGAVPVGNPSVKILNDHLMRVDQRILNGHTLAGTGSVPGSIYYGWLSDLWFRRFLNDPEYEKPEHSSFLTFQQDAESAAELWMDPPQGQLPE